MPHYNDLCQLSPFNFMDNAAKDAEVNEEVWQSFPECFQWVSIPAAEEQHWFTNQQPQHTIEKMVDPPILTDDGPMFFSRYFFCAKTLEEYNDRLKQSRALCLADLRRKGVSEATIKAELQWRTGHQSWELTLWGTNAD